VKAHFIAADSVIMTRCAVYRHIVFVVREVVVVSGGGMAVDAAEVAVDAQSEAVRIQAHNAAVFGDKLRVGMADEAILVGLSGYLRRRQ
jgi:hypothetical protein